MTLTVARTAHVNSPPAAIATASATPVTATARERVTRVPSPSCPKVLLPQQRTVRSARNAHAWYVPAEIAIAASHAWPPQAGAGAVEGAAGGATGARGS